MRIQQIPAEDTSARSVRVKERKNVIATEEQMKDVLAGKLFPGKWVHIERRRIGENGKLKRIEKKSGYVTALYPHIFTVKIGRYTEAFRYSQLFETGAERVKLQ